MSRLEELTARMEDIAVNSGMLASIDFFELAKKFFSKESVQEEMVKLNQDRLYEESTTNAGWKLPSYSAKTAKHKRRIGLPDKNYTYYETGRTHESLEVDASDWGVMITPSENAPEYANYLNGEAWGITPDQYDGNFREGLLSYIQKEIKDFING